MSSIVFFSSCNVQCLFIIITSKKSNKKIDGQNHHTKDKSERPKKAQKMCNPQEPKKGER